MVGHVYLYGVIGECPGTPAGSPIITLMDVISQIQKTKNAQTITAHINSPGGICDLGYKIAELLKSEGKPLTTIIEGRCASIATVILLEGDQRLAVRGSEGPMIHNPWTELRGDANQLEVAATEIRAEEDKLINFYAARTGLSKDALSALMNDQTSLPLEKAVEFGFLTGIVEQQKAVALHKEVDKKNNKDIMTEGLNKLADSVSKGFTEVMALITKTKQEPGKPMAFSVTGADGTIYTVAPVDGIEDGAAGVGDMMTLPDGTPADGTFIMPDGSTVTAAKGVVTAVTPAATSADTEKAALQKENEELKNKVAALEKSVSDFEPKMVEMAKQNEIIIAALKNTKSGYVPPVAAPAFAKKEEEKKEVDPFKEAMRIKEEGKKK